MEFATEGAQQCVPRQWLSCTPCGVHRLPRRLSPSAATPELGGPTAGDSLALLAPLQLPQLDGRGSCARPRRTLGAQMCDRTVACMSPAQTATVSSDRSLEHGRACSTGSLGRRSSYWPDFDSPRMWASRSSCRRRCGKLLKRSEARPSDGACGSLLNPNLWA